MVQFAVALKGKEWTVFRDAAPVAQGMSRSAAIRIAEEMAFKAEDEGERVELVIQDYTGELKARFSGGA